MNYRRKNQQGATVRGADTLGGVNHQHFLLCCSDFKYDELQICFMSALPEIYHVS